MNEKLFQRAIDNPSYRHQFIDKIHLEDAAPFIDRVKYSEEQPYEPFCVMCTFPPKDKFFGRKNKKSFIAVYPFSFERDIHPTYEDFLSTLIDHEGTHAKQNYFSNSKNKRPFSLDNLIKMSLEATFCGIRSQLKKERMQNNIDVAKKEIMAYNIQLSRGDKRGISEEYAERMQKNKELYNLLIKVSEIERPQAITNIVSAFLKFDIMEKYVG